MPAAEHRVRLPARYRVVRHIANGGMAGVWLAEDEVLGRPVAVKVLSAAFAADELAARRFEREARAAARLSDHPHVVTIYDYGRHEGHPFIVMEHFAGGTVADRLRGAAAVPRDVALRWLREAASALDAAHAAGVVHRDVKPHNLLLDGEDRLAVGDFGIATLAAETALTQAGLVLGTAAYLSPEQRAGRPATPASDRYALAVVARELLPGAAGSVIARGLAEDPAQRPPTAKALVDELDPAPAHTAPTASTRVLPASSPEPQRTHAARTEAKARGQRHRAAALAALAALFVCGAIAVAIATSGGGPGESERGADARNPTTGSTAERPPERPAKKEEREPRTQPPATSPTRSPRELNDLGFAKLPADPAGAIPLLRQAVDGFRAQARTQDINYAFALFNLGNALRLAGDPAGAIPFLEERLAVSGFKRGVVRRELQLAREQAGLAPAGKGRRKGEERGQDDD
jgi:serine/threonine-protein kinase